MSEPQSPASVPATLTQVNADFANARAARLDAAMTKALAGKLEAPPAPKAGKAPPSPAASTSGPAEAAGTGSAPDAPGDAAEPAETAPDASAPPADEPQDAPVAAEQTAVDVAALTQLAKKRDLRAIEKQLGLEEGILGATNGEYAALRRRLTEVEQRETTVQATHEQNNAKLIAKFGPAVDMIERAQKGDLIAYARAVELTTGIRIETFIDHWSKNAPRLDPRVMHLEQENARLRNQTPPSTPQDAPAAVTPDAARKKADTYIATEAKDHPALKLRGGADDVRQKWLGSFDKATQAFKLTPKQAADAVVEERRKAHEQEQWILSGKTPPKKKPVTRTVPRTGASETQPRKQNLTRDQIIEQHAAIIRRQKASGR